jgi:ribose transport system permease protein
MTGASLARPRPLTRLLRVNPIWFVLLALLAAIVAMNPDFTEPQGYMNFLRRAAPLCILAAGQVFVLTSGGFDLSVGSTITLTVVGASMLLDNNEGATWWVILAMLATGVVIGLVNGLVVALLRVPSLIATLGTMITVGGIALVWSGGAPRGYLTDAFRSFGRFMWRDVPVIGLLPAALLVLLVVGASLWWTMHRTNYGRLLHAVGDNPEAARLAGVPVTRVRVLAFVISSASAVVAGVLLGGFSGVSLDVGNGYELQAITAAVLGGTQLLGGRGSVGAAVGGALTLMAIFTLLNFLGLPQPMREVVQGLILILAVAVAVRRRATG